jgi:aerobic-type carbon monoxide dehydrogenase small subunit (CoxS/CutS family)
MEIRMSKNKFSDLDNKCINTIRMLAVDAVGKKVTTVEGLSASGQLHPIQETFVKHDALQCGFCTPGMVMACKAILDQHRQPGRPIPLAQIKKGLSGNICRCGTYTRIFAAVETAAKLV